MNNMISVAFALACAVALEAQITTTLSHLPDGADEIGLRNNSATSLVASVVAGKRAIAVAASPAEALRNAAPAADPENTATLIVYSDPLIEPAKPPLPASEERVIVRMHFHQRSRGTVQQWSIRE